MTHARSRIRQHASTVAALLLAASLGGCSSKGAVHLRRGDQALAAGRYAEAISAYTHARELAPDSEVAQQGLMRARAALVAEQPMRLSAETAEDLRYEAALLAETDPARAATYLTALGNISSRFGNAEDARARFDAALKSDPRSVVAHTALGVFLLGQKESAGRAREEFEKVVELRPGSAVALVGLAQLALGEGKVDAAVEKLEAAIKVGDDFTARMLLGGARLKQSKSDEAITQFTRATQLDPRSAEAHRALGQALLSAGKAEEAERSLRTAAAIVQDAPTALALGFALQRQKKADQALGQFALVLQSSGGDPAAMYGAASALEDLGRKDEALVMYKRLAALPPSAGGGAPLMAQLQQQAVVRTAALEGKGEGAGSAPLAPMPPGAAPHRAP